MRSGRRSSRGDRIGQLNVNLQDKLVRRGGGPTMKKGTKDQQKIPKRGMVFSKDGGHCAYVYDKWFFDPNDYNALFVLPGGTVEKGPFGPFDPRDGFHLPPFSNFRRPLKDREECLNEAGDKYGACFVVSQCIGKFLKSAGPLQEKIKKLKKISGEDLIKMYYTL